MIAFRLRPGAPRPSPHPAASLYLPRLTVTRGAQAAAYEHIVPIVIQAPGDLP